MNTFKLFLFIIFLHLTMNIIQEAYYHEYAESVLNSEITRYGDTVEFVQDSTLFSGKPDPDTSFSDPTFGDSLNWGNQIYRVIGIQAYPKYDGTDLEELLMGVLNLFRGIMYFMLFVQIMMLIKNKATA